MTSVKNDRERSGTTTPRTCVRWVTRLWTTQFGRQFNSLTFSNTRLRVASLMSERRLNTALTVEIDRFKALATSLRRARIAEGIVFAEVEFFQGTARGTVFTKVLDRSRTAGLQINCNVIVALVWMLFREDQDATSVPDCRRP
jgi:hypothetical protein